MEIKQSLPVRAYDTTGVRRRRPTSKRREMYGCVGGGAGGHPRLIPCPAWRHACTAIVVGTGRPASRRARLQQRSRAVPPRSIERIGNNATKDVTRVMMMHLKARGCMRLADRPRT
jgi:hypothetical protein